MLYKSAVSTVKHMQSTHDDFTWHRGWSTVCNYGPKYVHSEKKKYTQRENRFIFIYIYSFTHSFVFFFIMYTHSTTGHIKVKVLKFPTVESPCRSKQTDLTWGRNGESRSSVYKIWVPTRSAFSRKGSAESDYRQAEEGAEGGVERLDLGRGLG